MSDNHNKSDSLFAEQESKLSAQSAAFIQHLTKRGILTDPDIGDEKIREAAKKKKRNAYHNTLLMLQHYRSIVWVLECFPCSISEDLNQPFSELDSIIDLISSELEMDNARLESRLQSVRRSRLLLDRVQDALTVLSHKPGNGELLYKVIFETYIGPGKPTHSDIICRLNISSRHYYRIRQQAINILSIRLWSVPAIELDSWLEVLTILEAL